MEEQDYQQKVQDLMAELYNSGIKTAIVFNRKVGEGSGATISADGSLTPNGQTVVDVIKQAKEELVNHRQNTKQETE